MKDRAYIRLRTGNIDDKLYSLDLNLLPLFPSDTQVFLAIILFDPHFLNDSLHLPGWLLDSDMNLSVRH